MNGCKEKTMTRKEENGECELIYAYTRAEAIADGVLVDVSEAAQKVGWNVPVAFTQSAYEGCIRAPAEVEAMDVDGRLRDVLAMIGVSAAAHRLVADSVSITVSARNLKRPEDAFTLKVVCAPGDDGEPVVTVMLPDDD